MAIHNGRDLGVALIKEGVVPENCRKVELHIGVDQAMFLRYEVWVTDEDIPKIQRALGTMLVTEEVKQ